MTLALLNTESSPTYAAQAATQANVINALIAAVGGTGWLTGGAVTVDTGLTVTVASGTGLSAGSSVSWSGTTVTSGAASGTDRIDVVVVNSSGVVSIVAGTACGTAGWTAASSGNPPVVPAVTAGYITLAFLYVPGPTFTTFVSANIWDYRVPAISSSGTGSGMTLVGDKSANYSLSANQFATANISSASITFTLPTAPANGTLCGGKIVVAGAGHTLTVSTGGSDVFDEAGGSTSSVLYGNGDSKTWEYDTANATWVAVSTDDPNDFGSYDGGTITTTWALPSLSYDVAYATLTASDTATITLPQAVAGKTLTLEITAPASGTFDAPTINAYSGQTLTQLGAVSWISTASALNMVSYVCFVTGTWVGLPNTTGTQVVTMPETVVALATTGTVTLDKPATSGQTIQTIAQTGNITIADWASPVAGESVTLYITTDSTHSVTFPSTNVRWLAAFGTAGGSAPTTGASHVYRFSIACVDGTHFDWSGGQLS
jgi:hypothetical protein